MKKIGLSAGRLQQLFEALCQEDCQIVGPTIRDGTIVYDELSSVDDAPMLKKCPGVPLLAYAPVNLVPYCNLLALDYARSK
jgi:hypothetical protein